MSRNRASARAAGASFERSIADYFAEHLDDRIDRRVKTGAKDKGDLANVRTSDNQRVVVEAKNYGGQLKPSEWLREAETERVNDQAAIGVVIAKRRGITNPGQQYALLTVDTLLQLLQGARPEVNR